jgi:alanyl-tRNA synthetase
MPYNYPQPHPWPQWPPSNSCSIAAPYAGPWVQEVVGVMGGKGGGKPTSAQGTGTDLSAVDRALEVAASLAALAV